MTDEKESKPDADLVNNDQMAEAEETKRPDENEELTDDELNATVGGYFLKFSPDD